MAFNASYPLTGLPLVVAVGPAEADWGGKHQYRGATAIDWRTAKVASVAAQGGQWHALIGNLWPTPQASGTL